MRVPGKETAPAEGKVKVILVTDGDETAKRAVEVAARNIGGRCISASAVDSFAPGAEQLMEMIRSAAHGPVVVMCDDRGESAKGQGEKLLATIAQDPDIEVLGAIAVASHTPGVAGVEPDVSITKDGDLVDGGVSKEGQPVNSKTVKGDTVDVLRSLNIPVIVGLGDPGKMEFADDADTGAPITTMALQEIIRRSGSQS